MSFYFEHVLTILWLKYQFLITFHMERPGFDTSQFSNEKVRNLLLPVDDRLTEGVESFLNNREPFLYIKGIPIPKTSEGQIDNDATNSLALSLGGMLGEIFVSEGHREGLNIFDIYPIYEDAGEQLGTGTALDWHTDDAHHPSPCVYICLLCLRGDPNAKTYISKPIDALLPMIPQAQRETLVNRKLQIEPDHSYRNTFGIQSTTVYGFQEGSLEIRYDPAFTNIKDDNERLALKTLECAFADTAHCITLSEGDFLVINNRLAAHARSSFQPSYDKSKDRWLKRIIVK